MTSPISAKVQVDEQAPQNFTLSVTFDGQRFDCGSYDSRPEALKAGRLFLDRKTAEQAGRKKRPRKS